MKLEFRLINGQTISHEMKKTTFVIGRSSGCDVILPFDGFSRNHCQVELGPEGDVYLTDLGSANGVMIDGDKIIPHTKTLYNTMLPLVIGPAEITLELDVPAPLTNPASSSTTPGIPIPPPLRSPKPIKKKYDFKSLGLVALVVVGFLVYKEIKNFMDGSQSEDDEISRMQFDAQMKGKSNDGSVKTSDF